MLSKTGNRFNAQDLWQKDRRHVLHPWTNFASFKEHGALLIAEGEGATITDVNGRRLLDAMSGMWCVNIGYGRKDMAEAIYQQALDLPYANAFVDMGSIPAAELGAKLAEIAPGSINHVAYSTCGSTANDTAVRLAHFYHARRGEHARKFVISRENSYHGSTYLAITLGRTQGDHSNNFYYVDGLVHHLSAPYTYRPPEGVQDDQLTDYLVAEFKAKIRELGKENIAAFIAEPMQGAGGALMPPKDYLPRMADVARENGILLITDEVATGFGRLGHWFASKDVFGVEPDIITSAKGLTSGYVPLGATLYSDAIQDTLEASGPDVWFAHGFTYSGHPLACTAALKNIEIIEREEMLANARTAGDYLEREMRTLADLPIVGDVRGHRLMMCLEYVADKQSKELLPDEIDISRRISDAAEARGLLVRPVGHIDLICPPLTLTTKDADVIVETMRAAIEEVSHGLRREGIIS